MTSADLAELPDAVAKKLPRYPKIPAALLGRLAVDRRFRGQHLGHRLAFDAMVQVLASKIASAMLIVDAKDEAAAGFYIKFGFMRFSAHRLQLYMTLQDIKALVE